MQQTPLHHAPNLDLLNVIPKATRVVEAGASSGALAQAYKQHHPECHYIGIEIDSEFAVIASKHCDQVLLGDLDALSTLPPPQSLKAECWVFGDCLEHLNDPWRVLRWVHQLQPEGGIICACIPNAQHWSVQTRLNSGDFFYQSSGLLDRTHLRWIALTYAGSPGKPLLNYSRKAAIALINLFLATFAAKHQQESCRQFET